MEQGCNLTTGMNGNINLVERLSLIDIAETGEWASYLFVGSVSFVCIAIGAYIIHRIYKEL